MKAKHYGLIYSGAVQCTINTSDGYAVQPWAPERPRETGWVLLHTTLAVPLTDSSPRHLSAVFAQHEVNKRQNCAFMQGKSTLVVM